MWQPCCLAGSWTIAADSIGSGLAHGAARWASAARPRPRPGICGGSVTRSSPPAIATLLGEFDLVAVDGRTVVFVEVKTRESHEAGHPVEAVDADKQARLTRLALAYLKRHDLLECPARFDVVAITWPERAGKPQIEHFANAFEPTGRGQMFS